MSDSRTHKEKVVAMALNKIKRRREKGAVCPKCKSPDWVYLGLQPFKHCFKCNSCVHCWSYGNKESKYTKLI